jgi:hypothetical protein
MECDSLDHKGKLTKPKLGGWPDLSKDILMRSRALHCGRFCSGQRLFEQQNATTFKQGCQTVPSKSVIFRRIQRS